jgi:tetratricopeptide (TPR) repeat protein
MDYQALLDRIAHIVDQRAYFTPVTHVADGQRAVLAAVQRRLASGAFDPDEIRAYVRAEQQAGRIDRVMMLSALHVIACHPAVADWEDAARLVGEQELAALELGGPYLEANLASVDRHRGVLAFLRQHYEVALDYFARALERQRTAENFTNVLCTLIRLGDEGEARSLLDQARRAFPPGMVVEIEHNVQSDPDLVLLRDPADEPPRTEGK